ncbi:coproporphyrinogen III oxidase, anaerobic [Thalassoporum mexicanum PCC 7367]|uniref:radical SAM family heme chaperone HemW n=1 Tax=Thalassoporum mexicanum TaxID=3457544 RepID=UPI00029FA096|nr:radical SAM family heme chaperone HemW [Pseudanabaena sp. PCC 7367]AFY71361.1 coproporphyrinogen III oxidase, anaerobic [Pseudanabaena sp. PCC 7367]
MPVFTNQATTKSIYLHIPFCDRKCFYCDFAITTGGENLKREYVEAICAEIKLTAAQERSASNAINQGSCIKGDRPPLQTVFFGGGTPSLLTVAQLAMILAAIRTSFGIAENAEISIEANPGTVSIESLSGYKSLGVNRISLGVQAFQAHLLNICGRAHGVAEIFSAIAAIKAAGINNFSLDLISGLPEQTIADWQESLDLAIELQPTHMSVYDLTIEPGTAFGKRYVPGDQPLPTEATTVEMYLIARQKLIAAGFEHYEISNYAKPGYQCQHNLTYWHNQPFWGMGMGATSYVGQRRIDRPRKMRDYLNLVKNWQEQDIAPTAPMITPEEELLDTLMQGLRLAEGIGLSDLEQKYGQGLIEKVMATLQPHFDRGWARIINKPNPHLILTAPEGWLMSDQVIGDLYRSLID